MNKTRHTLTHRHTHTHAHAHTLTNAHQNDGRDGERVDVPLSKQSLEHPEDLPTSGLRVGEQRGECDCVGVWEGRTE
jgi:hypothetical protein